MSEVTHDGQRWSNAEVDQIVLWEHNPRWSNLFAEEVKAIRAGLDNDLNPQFEHFGSTAIPGIAAKPIIDIMLIIPPEAGWERLIAPLESLNYLYWAENPQSDRLFFVKEMPPYGSGRTHHVHVRPNATRELLFRDYLIEHPDEAARYEALKRKLADHFPTNREAYTNGKDAFIDEIVKKARLLSNT